MVIVEDEPALREMLRAYLQLHGFEVLAACAEGESGLELVIDLRPDVVVLDWHLPAPGLDGAETLAYLRHRAADTPVVIYTHDTSATRAAVDQGAAAVIDKGSPVTRLEAAILGTTAAGRPAARPARRRRPAPRRPAAG